MDLIPLEYRQRQRQRSLLRKLGLACLLVLAGIAVAWTLLAYLTWREKLEVARLERQDSVAQKAKAKAEAYRQSKQAVEKQLLALDELRGRARVGQFLHAIDAAYGEGIWFDSLHFQRGSDSATAAPGATAYPPAAALEVGPGVDIVGHALNHSLLAEFLRKFAAQPGVADLRLIDTSMRNYTTTQVVDFTIRLQLDNKAQP